MSLQATYLANVFGEQKCPMWKITIHQLMEQRNYQCSPFSHAFM